MSIVSNVYKCVNMYYNVLMCEDCIWKWELLKDEMKRLSDRLDALEPDVICEHNAQGILQDDLTVICVTCGKKIERPN